MAAWWRWAISERAARKTGVTYRYIRVTGTQTQDTRLYRQMPGTEQHTPFLEEPTGWLTGICRSCGILTGDILILQNEISSLGYIVSQNLWGKGMRITSNPSPIDQSIREIDMSGIKWLLLNEIEGRKPYRRERSGWNNLQPSWGIPGPENSSDAPGKKVQYMRIEIRKIIQPAKNWGSGYNCSRGYLQDIFFLH